MNNSNKTLSFIKAALDHVSPFVQMYMCVCAYTLLLVMYELPNTHIHAAASEASRRLISQS